MREKTIDTALLLTVIGWVCAGLFAFAGLYRSEPELKNPRKIEAISKGLEKGAIVISQSAPNQPLVVAFDRAKHSQQFTDNEWNELEETVKRFVAASNWGLGSPFKYQSAQGSPGQVVIAFKTDEFKYVNPFEHPPVELVGIPIKSAAGIAQTRKGWRIIGPNFSLFLKADAPTREAEVASDGRTREGTTLVAQQFLLRANNGNSLRVSIAPSANADDQTSTTLRVNLLDDRNQSDAGRRYRSGEYFSWQGQPYVAYEISQAPTGTPPPPGGLTAQSGPLAHDDLIVTKRINGRATRVHLLGQSTANLIGVRVGGYLPLLDGAIEQDKVSEVRLTLDPDLQNGAFYLLTSALQEIDGKQGIGRRRRGSVAVLDANNGAILALTGYPSLDADWLEHRRVLTDRDQLVRSSPALDKHMPGSAVKVLTVSLGFLLDGAANADLLPRSDNVKAVRQAFHDAYGVALKAPLEGDKARVTPAARKEFDEVGTSSRVREECAQVLWDAFRVLPNVKAEQEKLEKEEIVRGNVSRFFSANELRAVFPVTSRWPVKDDNTMDRLRLHALGSEEARFTTLRLAAILGTASTGKRYEPFLVEAVQDKSGAIVKSDQVGVSDLNLPVADGNRHIATMQQEMATNLRKVLFPGGTGFFNLETGSRQFLGNDDPTTIVNEEQTRSRDYGKSGTAAYEERDDAQPDSIFVYRHGRFLIAVWLEQSDFGATGQNLRGWSDNPAHKVVHRLIQIIENLEHQSNSI